MCVETFECCRWGKVGWGIVCGFEGRGGNREEKEGEGRRAEEGSKGECWEDLGGVG